MGAAISVAAVAAGGVSALLSGGVAGLSAYALTMLVELAFNLLGSNQRAITTGDDSDD